MWTYIGGVFVLISLLILPLVLAVSRRRRILKSIPGLEETFILGHTLHFMNKSPSVILETLNRGFRENGRVWKALLFHDTILLVSDPKIIEVVLSSKKFIRKSTEYTLLQNWLGDGLLLSKGKKWLGRRKTITPAFHFKILEQFVEVFDRNSDTFVKILGEHGPNDPVDIYPFVTLGALDVICETSMGCFINAQKQHNSEYVQAVKDISYVLHLRMFDVTLRNNLTFFFSKAARVERKALKVLHEFTDSVIIARRKELLDQQANNSNTTDDLGIRKKQALLDVLLQSTIDGKPLTNQDIREEVDTFMFEGHDTTTSGITFALYCLATHPEVQQKVVKEIHDVIGVDKSTPVTLQMLNDLNYLDLVLKEVLRLYPSVPLFGRLIEEDTVINNVKIPAGTNLVVSSLAMQRDAEIFPDPEEFRPERFSDERKIGEDNPYSYVPFSAGPRNCIGQKFAVLEMKSLVSKVLRNFKISMDPSYRKPVLIAEIILKPENGIFLNLKKRE